MRSSIESSNCDFRLAVLFALARDSAAASVGGFSKSGFPILPVQSLQSNAAAPGGTRIQALHRGFVGLVVNVSFDAMLKLVATFAERAWSIPLATALAVVCQNLSILEADTYTSHFPTSYSFRNGLSPGC